MIDISHRRLRLVERGFLLAGVVLFGVLLHQTGPRAVVDNLRLVGWGIVLIVGQEALAIAANTLGWRCAFPNGGPPVSLPRLLAARLAGDSINYVTPTATLGGEFVRVRVLRSRRHTTELVASVAIAKLAQTVGQLLFIVLGLLLVLDEVPLPARLRHGLVIAIGVMAAIALALFVAQRRGLFAPMVRAADRLGLSRYAPQAAERLQHLDAEIARFHGSDPRAFAASCLWFLAGWACGILEVYLILWFLQVPVTVERALAVEVLSATIDAVLFFVPGKVGTQEGGKVLIFTLLGLDPAKGLAMGIVRRIRELAWAGIGLLVLSRLQATARPARRAASTAAVE